MAGSQSNDEEQTNDRIERHHSVPAANLKEAWPIAQIAAYREMAAPLAELHDSLSAGSGTSVSPSSIQRRILAVIELLNDRTKQRFEEYIQAATTHPLHADSLRAAGVPEHITYDSKSGIPFLTWLTVMEGPQLNWRQLHINIAEDRSGQPLILTPPFRPVRLESLPPNSLRILIADPVHAATIAVAEVMDAAFEDIVRAKASISARDNWVRMQCVANFYTAIVQERMKELALDDYRDWVVTLPAQIPIMSAPAVIARHGSNAVVIQLLALRTVANFLLDSLDRTENEPGNVDQSMMVDQVLGEMRSYRDKVVARMNSLNALLIAEHVSEPENYVPQVISRPVPRGTPLIAMIPKDSNLGQGGNITPLRRE